MSLLANIAAGALGGAGDSLSNIGRTQAKAEIEEAKELRARAFQKEMYEQQRFDNRIDTAAANEFTRQTAETRYSQDRLGQLEEMKYRTERDAVGDKRADEAARIAREQHDALMESNERALKAAEEKAKTDAEKRELDAFKEFNSVVRNELDALSAIETEMTKAIDEESRIILQKKWDDQNRIVQNAREIARNAEPSFMRTIRQELDNSDIMASTGLDLKKINTIKQGYDNNGIQEIARLINLGESDGLSAKDNEDARDAKRIFAAAKIVNPELYEKLVELTSGATSRRTDIEHGMGLSDADMPEDVAIPRATTTIISDNVPLAEASREQGSAQGLLTKDSPENQQGLLTRAMTDIDMQIRNTKARIKNSTGREREKLELLLEKLLEQKGN